MMNSPVFKTKIGKTRLRSSDLTHILFKVSLVFETTMQNILQPKDTHGVAYCSHHQSLCV